MSDDLIKKPRTKILYNKQTLDELRRCSDPIHGAEYFLDNFVYIQHPTKGKIKLDMFDFQRDLLRNYLGYGICPITGEMIPAYTKCINMLGRQMGKTTIAAGYLLWQAMFIGDQTILVSAHKHDGAMEVLNRVRFAYESCPDHIRSGVEIYNRTSIEFDNGSRIIGETTTANTGRGKSASLVYLDEMAFVEPNISTEMITSLLPTLSTGGSLIITSTPNVADDMFAQLWNGANDIYDDDGEELPFGVGSNGFKAFKATWIDHPDRDEDWGKLAEKQLGREMHLRENCCEFISVEETLITAFALDNCINSRDPTLYGKKYNGINWFSRSFNPDFSYVIALDPSMGTGGDNAAICVIECQTLKQVAEWKCKDTGVEGQVEKIRQISEFLYNRGAGEIYWSLENNTVGEAALVAIRHIGEEYFHGTMIHDPNSTSRGAGRKRKGFHTTNKTKLEACSKLKSLVESNKLTICSKALHNELRNYISYSSSFKASSGKTDDLVSALLVAIRMVGYVATFDEATWEAVNQIETVNGLEVVDDENDDNEEDDIPYIFV